MPSLDGFHLPFEGLKHESTFVLMPYRSDTWRDHAIPAQEAFFNVITAIALHEKVVVGIQPAFYKKLSPMFAGIPNVTPLAIRYNDSWARDNMPLFVSNGKSIRSVDFRFNAWGGSYDGLYRNYRDDDHLAAVVSKKMKLLSYYLPSFVLEGGSIAVDGEGTLITTEACLLSKGRNPTLRKTEIEEILRDYLGVEKVVWVPHGIYQDETDEHIDNMVSFIRPGELAMAWTNDKDDPQYAFCQETFAALSAEKDAQGRSFVIHKILLPTPALYLSKEECKGLVTSCSTLDKRVAGRRLAASYINYYQGEDFIILPAFDVKEDGLAYDEFKKLYPNKTIHQVRSKEILLGGGNIHCITMQVPLKEE
jgi:agmatine deiminase